MGKLDGKVALITGSSGGQGEAEGRLFASEGATVVLADVLVEQGRALAAELTAAGHRAVFVHLDVSDVQRWAEVVAQIEQDFGRLDVLVNNAGVSDRRGITEHDEDAFDRVLDINLWGPVAGMQACAPLMGRSGGGAVVNISSVAAMMGFHGAAYTSSKWGLRGVTKSAALELSSLGIRVNSVHPGTIRTPMIASSSDEAVKKFADINADQRVGEPIEIARTVLHLACDDSSYTTGAEAVVDGGFVAVGAHRAQSLVVAQLEKESE